MTGRPAAGGQCRGCAHFRNDPAFLERLLPGLAIFSSADASVRADDGLCLHHDRYLSDRSCCPAFIGREPTRGVACRQPDGTWRIQP